MTESEENRFDSRIRAILGDAAEEVPSGLWDGIEKRLAAGDTGTGDAGEALQEDRKRKRIVPLWARTASGIAAAAVIAAGLFLSGIFDDTVSDYRYDTLALSDSGTAVGIERNAGITKLSAADIPQARPLGIHARHLDASETEKIQAQEGDAGKDIPENSASGTVPDMTVSGQDNELAGTEGGNADAAESTGTGTSGTGNGTASQNGTDGLQSDAGQWEELLVGEDDRQSVRTSITLSGNAISNTNASASHDMNPVISYRPGRNDLTKDMISESSESSYSIPLSFGLGVKIDFSDRWSLGVGVNYSHLRRTFAGNFFDVRDDGTFTETSYSNIMNRQDYIGIPLNVYYNILGNSFMNFYAYVGGTAEKCVSNRFLMPAGDRVISHREAVRGFQFSADLGLGMEFIIADTFGIFIDPSLRYYFPDKRQPRSIRTDQPLMFGLELGLRIHL